MGHGPHLLFLNSKQPIWNQSYKSLWVPALICWFCMRNSDFRTKITSLYWHRTSPVVLCMQNSVICTRITCLYWYQTSPVFLCMKNSVISPRITTLYWSQTSPVVLCMKKSVFSTRMTSFYWSHTSSVDLWMLNSVISTRITSLCGSQPSSLVFACKTACIVLYLSFRAFTTAWSAPELLVAAGLSSQLWFCSFKTATL